MHPLLVLFILACLILPGPAQELEGSVPVPPGVRYTPANAQQDKAAVDTFTRVMKSESSLDSPIMVGPILSNSLGSIQGEEVIPATYQVPRVEGAIVGKGWVLRGPESPQEFSRKLATLVGEEPAFRRPTEVEMQYYWALAPFDLEGSIFVCQGKDVTLFCNFVGDDFCYFEDVSSLGKTLNDAYQSLAGLPNSLHEPDIQPDYIQALSTGDSLPEPLEQVESITESTIILLTHEELLQQRTNATDLSGYLQPLIETSQKFLKKHSLKQCYIQVDLGPGRQPVLRVGGRPKLTQEAADQLLEQLRKLPAPEVLGPVCVFSVECSE